MDGLFKYDPDKVEVQFMFLNNADLFKQVGIWYSSPWSLDNVRRACQPISEEDAFIEII